MTEAISLAAAATALKGLRTIGQKIARSNSLMDETHLAGIAQDVASLFPATAARRLAVEYGGGLGALTESLLREDLTVHCVERDRDLVLLLKNHFARPLQEKIIDCGCMKPMLRVIRFPSTLMKALCAATYPTT